MFNAMKNLVSPKMVQSINHSVYDAVKLSLFMGIFSFPWALVNLLFKFTPETFFLYAVSFGTFIPNILAGITLLNKQKEVNFKSYYSNWKNSWQKNGRLILFILGGIVFWIIDTYIVVERMKVTFIFPVMYITMMFLAIAAIYLLLFQINDAFSADSWQQQLKKAAFYSWRFVGKTVIAFLITILWLSIGYYLQGVNFILGNGIAWMVIERLLVGNSKKIDQKMVERRTSHE